MSTEPPLCISTWNKLGDHLQLSLMGKLHQEQGALYSKPWSQSLAFSWETVPCSTPTNIYNLSLALTESCQDPRGPGLDLLWPDGIAGPQSISCSANIADLCASAQLCWPAWSFCYLYASPTVCYKTQIFTHAKFTVGPHREVQAPLPHFPRWYFPWDKGMKGWCLQQGGEMPEVLITLQLKMEISVMIPKQAAKIWKSGNSVNLEFDIRTGWFQLDVHAFISLVIPFFFFLLFTLFFFQI